MAHFIALHSSEEKGERERASERERGRKQERKVDGGKKGEYGGTSGVGVDVDGGTVVVAVKVAERCRRRAAATG